MLKLLPPDDCATPGRFPPPAVKLATTIDPEVVKAADPDKRGIVVLGRGMEFAGMTPPPCVEFDVAALPETTAETAPCDAVPFAVTEGASALDFVDVGTGISIPAPAVALEVSV